MKARQNCQKRLSEQKQDNLLISLLETYFKTSKFEERGVFQIKTIDINHDKYRNKDIDYLIPNNFMEFVKQLKSCGIEIWFTSSSYGTVPKSVKNMEVSMDTDTNPIIIKCYLS